MLVLQEIFVVCFLILVIFGLCFVLFSNDCRCVPSRLMLQLAIISGNRPARVYQNPFPVQVQTYSWSERQFSEALVASASPCTHQPRNNVIHPTFRTEFGPQRQEKLPTYEECCEKPIPNSPAGAEGLPSVVTTNAGSKGVTEA